MHPGNQHFQGEKMCRQKNVKDLCDPVNSGVAYLLG